MVDTMVLIHAAMPLDGRPADDELCRKRTDARALLRSLDEVYASVITQAEFEPTRDARSAKALEPVLKGIKYLALDSAATSLAVEIIRRRQHGARFCDRCLRPKGQGKCKGCGASLSRQQRINDIFIGATASAAGEVTTLYTYDRELLGLNDELPAVAVMEPPSASGPLFDCERSDEGILIPMVADSTRDDD